MPEIKDLTRDEKAKEMELLALDFIASMVYQTKLNVLSLERKVMKLRPSSLKDVVILFVANQNNWLNKLMRGCKAIGLHKEMERDLTSDEIHFYSGICELARMTPDMEAAFNLMQAISIAGTINEDTQVKIINLLAEMQAARESNTQ